MNPGFSRRDFVRTALTGVIGLSLEPGRALAASPQRTQLKSRVPQ